MPSLTPTDKVIADTLARARADVTMNWDDPAARASLIERVGVDEYNRLFEAHRKATVVATENGHDIRPVNTRFGLLYVVDGLGRAHRDLDEAKAIARGER